MKEAAKGEMSVYVYIYVYIYVYLHVHVYVRERACLRDCISASVPRSEITIHGDL